MRRLFSVMLLCAVLAGSKVTGAEAPQAGTPPKPTAAPAMMAPPAPDPAKPIRVEVLIQRKKGTQVLSSLPFTLIGETGNGTSDTGLSLRLGSNVPIQMGGIAGQSGGPSIPMPVSVNYQNVGTNIDCYVRAAPDGRYHVRFILNDSSVADAGGADGAPGPVRGVVIAPVIRSYQINTYLVAKDGERQQVNVATDKVSGETVVAEITITGL